MKAPYDTPRVGLAAGGAGCRAAAGCRRAGLLLDRGVRLHDVDLPRLLARPAHPDLVLDGVTAGGVLLDRGVEALGREAAGRGGHPVRGGGPDAEVIHD